MKPQAKKARPAPAEIAYERRSESGYDLGLHTEAEVGEVDVGVTVDERATPSPMVGLSVTAPVLGRVALGLLLDPDGTAQIAALTRELDGRTVSTRLPSEEEFQAQLAALELRLAHEKARAAKLEAEVAALRATQLENTLDATRFAELTAERDASNEIRELAEKARAELEARLAETLAAQGQIQQRLGETEALLADSEKALAEVRAEREVLDADKTSAEEAAKTVSSELGRAKKDAARLQQSVDALNSELGKLRFERESLKNEVEALQDKVTSTEVEVEEAHKLREGDAAKLAEEVVAARAAAEQAANDALQKGEEIQRLTGELEAAAAEKEQIERALADKDAELEKFRAEVLEAQAEASEREAQANERATDLERKLGIESERASGYETSYRHAQARISELEPKILEAGTRLDQAHAEIEALTTRAQQAEASFEEAQAAVAEWVQYAETVKPQLEQLTQERDEAVAKGEGLAKELAAEREISAGRLAELKEEQARREELLGDIEYIRSQVADLASTKGSLLTRLDQMAGREVKRQASTSEMNEKLRDAEVVAADRAASMRRLQARAEKLETQLAEAKAELAADRQQILDAQRALGLIKELTAERDALRIQISYFQKQVGALQRARENAGGPATVPGIPSAKATAPMKAPDRDATDAALPRPDLPPEWATEPPALEAEPKTITGQVKGVDIDSTWAGPKPKK